MNRGMAMDAIDRIDFGLYMDICAEQARKGGQHPAGDPAEGGGETVLLTRTTIDKVKGW